ncbi:hypothetical protein [Rhizobium leguminosarum]|uniref:hypothetical protein n=1 Tax=Rhizobium leguminosarum TaxID=384 RepID=UPI003F983DC7
MPGQLMRFSVDKDFILALARILFGTGLGKIGGAVALVGASSASGLLPWIIYTAAHKYLGWDLPPSDAPLWFGVFLVVAGLGTAILGTYWQRPSEPIPSAPIVRPHDIALYRRFRELLPDHAIDFIKDYDFGNSFDMRYIEGVLELGERWQGPRFEFSIPEFETSFATVKQTARTFAEAVTMHVHHVRGNPNWGTTKPDNFNGEYSLALRAVNKKLNDLATDFYQAVTTFERLAGPELLRD